MTEVIELGDLPRPAALVRSVFAHAQPTSVGVTTQNVNDNVRHESLVEGAMRHAGHRLEGTRSQLQG